MRRRPLRARRHTPSDRKPDTGTYRPLLSQDLAAAVLRRAPFGMCSFYAFWFPVSTEIVNRILQNSRNIFSILHSFPPYILFIHDTINFSHGFAQTDFPAICPSIADIRP